MKGFKFLVLGTIFAKLFGIIRELLVLSEFGYSQEISSYFALIAILGVLTFFSDTSIINSVAFPIWLSEKSVVIRLNYKIILFILIIPFLLFLYNYIIFDTCNNIHLMMVISIIIIPLVINSILYSVLIYLDKKKEFLLVAFLNGIVYLSLTFVLIEYGVIGLIYSRLIAIIFNVLIILTMVRKDMKIRFMDYRLKMDFVEKSIVRFVSVNNVLMFVLMTRIFSSLFFKDQMALINYSMIIILTFYTVFSKNLNSQLIKGQIETFKLGKKIKSLYWYMSVIFFLIMLLVFFAVPMEWAVHGYEVNMYMPLKLSLFLIIPVLVLGYLDLLRQVNLSNKGRFNLSDFMPVTFGFVFYYVVIVSCFI